MKEITRIHLAKIPYDVETGAKKALEAYLKSLEAYSADTEIMTDVEIRITEILSERGVQKNGVISETDVAALKEQLGEPREFMDDGDAAVTEEAAEAMTAEPGRKLFRDTDRAVLGGVLSGIAAFTKLDIVWVRLIFIIIALASFGTALLVYIVLWLAVPAARTAADKLQMSGRPVTVSAIRDLNEREPVATEKKPNNGQRVALSLLGVAFVFGGLITAAVIVAALVALVFAGHWHELDGMAGVDFFQSAFVFGIASGVLFVALMVLSAYASFARKLTKRVAISGGVIIVLGLMSFTVGASLAQYGADLNARQIQENTHESALELPANTRSATALRADAPGMTIEYIVDEQRSPRASMQLFAYDGNALPKVVAALKDGVLTVEADRSAEPACARSWCMSHKQKVTIYGPALESVAVDKDTTINYETNVQDKLAVTTKENASMEITGGTVQRLSAVAAQNSSVAASGTTVKNATAHLGASAQFELGTVANLNVSDEKSCPSGEREARVSVWNVMGGELTFNGKKQPAKTFDSGCTEIDIEGENARD